MASNSWNRYGNGQLLSNIGDLWVAAAAFTGAAVRGIPLGPVACQTSADNDGDAYTNDNSGGIWSCIKMGLV
jgi:hypothetical protein